LKTTKSEDLLLGYSIIWGIFFFIICSFLIYHKWGIYYVLGFITIWTCCGVASSGFYFANMQRKYQTFRKENYHEDKQAAFFTLILGIIGLLTDVLGGRLARGWLWPWGKKARLEAGIR
jgi:Mn2+/Fe2+ NRAMP family transporter